MKLRNWIVGMLAMVGIGVAKPSSGAELPDLGPLHHVVYASGRFVAVGASGHVAWSQDGLSWNSKSLNSASAFVDVIHTGTEFVAVDAQGRLARSTDGAEWTVSGPAEIAGSATGLAYGEGVYVMVDDFGAIYSSATGSNWSPVFEPAENAFESLSGVSYGNGYFVAVGTRYDDDFDPYGLVRASSNGSRWTRERNTLNEELYGIEWVDTRFVAVGVRFNADLWPYSQVLTSAQGTSWSLARPPGTEVIWSVTGGKGVMACLGEGGLVLVQTLEGWQMRRVGSPTVSSVAYGDGRFVGVGEKGVAALSEDGKVWLGISATAEEKLTSIVSDGNGGLIQGSASGTIWLRPASGSEWLNTYYDPNVEIHTVAQGEGMVLAVGVAYDDEFNAFGVILRSTDGRNWEEVRRRAGEEIRGVTIGSGKMVAVGADDGILTTLVLTSSDGRSWSSHNAGTGVDGFGLNAVNFGQGRFVAVGDSGTLITSSNSTTWTVIDSPLSTNLKAVSLLNGQYVAVGEKGAVLRSTDGVTWSSGASAATGLSQVVHNGSDYFVVGDGGYVARSRDLLSWSPIISGVTNDLHGAVIHDGNLWVVGNGGTIRQISTSVKAPASMEARRTANPSAPLILVLHGDPGSAQRIEQTADLGAVGSWSILSRVQIGTGGTAEVPLPVGGERRFYRGVVE
ncbi:MAG: hypothetical protein IT581_02575 [Verrucomicrobiales bacterium]|nr:hypothetical protein [Verrucomicrobiales bacterium]